VATRRKPGTNGHAGATKRREKAADLLGAGVPTVEVAKTVGVHENTVRHYATEPEVKAKAAKTAEEIIEGVRQELLNAAKKAALTLIAGLDEDIPGERRQNAVQILDRLEGLQQRFASTATVTTDPGSIAEALRIYRETRTK